MSNFILSCCSTADMPKDFFTKRNIPYVCFNYKIDNKEYEDDLGESIAFEDFYNKIANGAMPTTSQVNVEKYVKFFEPFLMRGLDILHITLSSGISGSYNSACMAQKELSEKYPERKISIVDSLAASSGYGLLMDMAADVRDNGGTFEEVKKWVEDNRLNVHHWFFSTNLTHYKRGGRISAVSAIAGTILGICPLMNVSFDGKLIPRKKIRGKKNVIEETFQCMCKHAKDGLSYAGKCFICHSNCYDDAKNLADLVTKAFPKLSAPVLINNIGTVIGSHTGPGTVALFFYGDKRID